jgi:hypothetical protein
MHCYWKRKIYHSIFYDLISFGFNSPKQGFEGYNLDLISNIRNSTRYLVALLRGASFLIMFLEYEYYCV